MLKLGFFDACFPPTLKNCLDGEETTKLSVAVQAALFISLPKEASFNMDILIEGARQAWLNFGDYAFQALVYAIAATVAALILGWGKVGFETQGDTLALKLPGGGVLASPPIIEIALLGFLIIEFFIDEQLMKVYLFLIFFIVLRSELSILTHVLSFFGSIAARVMKLKFAVVCMDKRCSAATGSGSYYHYYLCGGWTLLSAVGFAPLILIPVFLGLPEGWIGSAMFVFYVIPYPFLFGKLLAPKLGETAQKILKVPGDILMFLTEWPGWLLSSLTLSIVTWRLMIPRISKTRLH